MPKIVSDANLQEFATKIKGKLSSVATSGSYTDLSNKPTIPTAPGTLNTNNTSAQTANSSESLSSTIKLHKVSKTGNYNDLLNKPTIPAAQVQSDWNATSGMGVILNKPSIPAVTNGFVEAKGIVGTGSGTTYALPDEATGSEDLVLVAADPSSQIDTVSSEIWTFELDNGNLVNKTVILG